MFVKYMNNLMVRAQATILYNEFANHSFMSTAIFRRLLGVTFLVLSVFLVKYSWRVSSGAVLIRLHEDVSNAMFFVHKPDLTRISFI